MPGQGYWGTTKPPPGVELNLGHPLAQQLVGCWVLSEGAGSFANNSGNSPLSIGALGPSTVWTPRGLTFDDTANSYLDVGSVHYAGLSSGDPWSYVFLDVIPGTQVNTDNEIFGRYAPGPGVLFQIGQQVTTNNVRVAWGNGASVIATASNALTVGVSHQVAFTADQFNLGIVYVNGVALASGTAAQPWLADGPATVGKRYAPSFDEEPWLGRVGSVLVYHRCLSPTELQQILVAPYDMFLPPVWRRYFVPVPTTTSRTGTASGSAGAQGQTSGSASHLGATTGHTGTQGLPAAVAARANPATGHSGVKGQTAAVATRLSAVSGHTALHGQDAGVAPRASAVTGHTGTAGQTSAVPRRASAVSGHTGARALDVGASARSAAHTGHTGTHGLPTSGSAVAGASQGHSGGKGQTAGTAALSPAGSSQGHTGAHGQTAGVAGQVVTGAAQGHSGAHGQTTGTAALPAAAVSVSSRYGRGCYGRPRYGGTNVAAGPGVAGSAQGHTGAQGHTIGTAAWRQPATRVQPGARPLAATSALRASGLPQPGGRPSDTEPG